MMLGLRSQALLVEAASVERARILVCRSRKRRVASQFEDLQACYLKLRKQNPNKASSIANGKMANGHSSGKAAWLVPHLKIAYMLVHDVLTQQASTIVLARQR